LDKAQKWKKKRLEVMSFAKIWKKSWQQHHLWFSIAFRPIGDNFRSIERLTCVFTCMLVNMGIAALLFGSNTNSNVRKSGVILLVSTLVGFFVVTPTVVVLFMRSGDESARDVAMRQQQEDAKKENRDRGFSLVAGRSDDPAKPDCCLCCKDWYCCCCGKRFPPCGKTVAWILCGVLCAGSIFLVLWFGLRFVQYPDTGSDLSPAYVNLYWRWVVCFFIGWLLDILAWRVILTLLIALVSFCREGQGCCTDNTAQSPSSPYSINPDATDMTSPPKVAADVGGTGAIVGVGVRDVAVAMTTPVVG